MLKNKIESDGSVDNKKARLMAQGFSLRIGVHFADRYLRSSDLTKHDPINDVNGSPMQNDYHAT